jgi:uncharacterized protein (TIGR02246 family)
MRHILGTLFLLIATVVAQAQTPDQSRPSVGELEKELRSLVQQEFDADVSYDAAAFDRLLADDAVVTFEHGDTATKSDIVKLLRTAGKEAHPSEIVALDETRVRAYGDAAVVTGCATTIEKTTRRITKRVSFTYVFVRRQGRWQIVALQLTPIEEQ